MQHVDSSNPSDTPSWRAQVAQLSLPLATAAFILILLTLGLNFRLSKSAPVEAGTSASDASAQVQTGEAGGSTADSSAATSATTDAAASNSATASSAAAESASANAADASPNTANPVPANAQATAATVAAAAATAAVDPPAAAVLPAATGTWLQGLDVGAAPLWSAAFDGSINDSLWRPIAGDWSFAENMLLQTDTSGFDLGTLYAESFTDFVYTVDVRHLEGVGAGVLFNVPQLGAVDGGHLVRFTDDNTGIFWGHFDAAGVFNGQGYAPTGAPGTGWHTIEIAGRGDSYALRLDDRLLAAGIPLQSRSGYPGLTTSQSSAAFANINIYPLTVSTTVVPGVVPGPAVVIASTDTLTSTDLLELETINGEWVQDENGDIRQLAQLAIDYTMGTGMAAESYRLDATIQLPDDPDLANAGGGMIFHMPDRESKENAHLVRLVNGGSGLTWGYFDATGRYVGQGYADLALTEDRTHQISLVVERDRYDVTVDDTLIIDNMPTQRDSGWIGLLSYRGPVTFRDMQLTLGNVLQ